MSCGVNRATPAAAARSRRMTATPGMLGPATYQRLAHPDVEIASAHAAAAAGTIFVVPTEGHYSVRAIAAAAPGPLWFQLYTFGLSANKRWVNLPGAARPHAAANTVPSRR